MNRRLQARIKKAHLDEHYTNVTYYAWGGKCWQRLSCPVYVGKEEIEEVRRSPTFARLLASYPRTHRLRAWLWGCAAWAAHAGADRGG